MQQQQPQPPQPPQHSRHNSDGAGHTQDDETQPRPRHPGKHALAARYGAVEDHETERLSQLSWLEREIRTAKRDKALANAGLPVIEGRWAPTPWLAPCRFHQLGVRQATAFVEQHVLPRVRALPSERSAVIYKVVLGNTHEFVGSTREFRAAMIGHVRAMLAGDASRFVVREASDEALSEKFNGAILLELMGHHLYRTTNSLDWLEVDIVDVVGGGGDDGIVEGNSSTAATADVLVRRELAAIEAHECWVRQRPNAGLNIWNPVSARFELRFGISLRFLRSILSKDDPRLGTMTMHDALEAVMQPEAGTGRSYIDYLRGHDTYKYAVSEAVDWYISPACVNCNWKKMIFLGGVSVGAKVPPRLPPGDQRDRIVYMDLFHGRR